MKISHFLTIVSLMASAAAGAQNLTSDDIILLSTNRASLEYTGSDVTVFVKCKQPFSIESSAGWLKAALDPDNPKAVLVKGEANFDNEPRTATVTFSNEAGCKRVLEVTQVQDQSVEAAPVDYRLAVASRTSQPTNNYGSDVLANAFDGKSNTFWHSGSQNTAYTVEVKLKDGQGDADYFMYNTRTDGSDNGHWGEFELLVKCGDESSYRSLGTYNAGYTDKMVEFAEPIKDMKAYKLIVKPGKNGWISASEIGMYRKVTASDSGADVFEDEMMLALKPGVTQAQIDAIPNDFYRVHAQRLFNGGYDTKYRYAKYECFKSVQVLSEEWRAPGKLYDQIPGVTGINFIPGRNAVIVRGIPDGQNVQLKVVAWWNGWEGGNFDGCNPITTTYPLHNGLNTIDYHCSNSYGDWPGLAYIAYFADDVDYTQTIEQQKQAHPDIEVHFVNGQVNGYLSLDKTNDEMYEICANAKNTCMDLVGERVHQIWTAKGLHDYCRAVDGKLGYLQYMNAIDSLIVWEHRSMGFEKYGRIPRNRSMAYVNFTYYMFQGGFGVSFHHDQESRVLNCKKLIYNDQDLVWGLSHEWGHQHQMNPYYCWSGLGEVSNNIQSYYNIAMMGYNTSGTQEGVSYKSAERPSVNEFNTAYDNFVKSTTYKPSASSENRQLAYENYKTDGAVNGSADYRSYISTLNDFAFKTKDEDPSKAVHINEVDVTTTLIPKLKLMIYFMQNPTGPKGICPDKPYLDFTADWYEALRQNDNSAGSQIEKTSTSRDKYELLAGAQNGNQNGALAQLVSKYPESTWSTHDYVKVESVRNQNANSLPFIMNWCRKCSRLTGYNLYRFFEDWGYFRTVALRIGDYANRWYIATPEMIDEFKADMDALVESGEIDEIPQEVLDAINACPHWKVKKPIIPNEHK